MFILYTSNSEILVTTKEHEEAFVAEWFADYTGRSMDDFDREEVHESEHGVGINSKPVVFATSLVR